MSLLHVAAEKVYIYGIAQEFGMEDVHHTVVVDFPDLKQKIVQILA